MKKPPVEIPHCPEAEAGALGCVFLADGKAYDMLDRLQETDFNDLRHIETFRAMLSLQIDGEAINTVTVHDRLKRDGRLNDAGGIGYISTIPDATPSPENFTYWLESLNDFSARRKMLADADELRRKALDVKTPVEPVKPKSKLPPGCDAAEFVATPLPAPPELVHGIIHKGCKLAIGGGSKTFKTWTFLDLALSISHGLPWLGFDTSRAKVDYVNFEIPGWGLHSRLQAVAEARGIAIEPGWLRIHNLRGFSAPYQIILPTLADEMKQGEMGLIIIDPIYKLYGGADENSARDISNLLNEFDALTTKTGAGIAFASHFSKGNQAGKESMDRISGSGVFARDPDAILTFTKHEQDGAFVFDATLRNFPAIEPFVVRFNYPLMCRDENLDPAKLKQAGGRKKAHTAHDAWLVLDEAGALTTSEWRDKCGEEKGIKERTFYDLRKELEAQKRILKSKATDKWQAVQPKGKA